MAKKVKTKKKHAMNLEELRAYRSAYGRGLGAKDYATYLGVPAGLFGGLSFLLLYNGWVTAVVALIGCIYGWRSIMPRVVRKQYEQEAFNQRNKFLNNITQALTDENATVLMALQRVTERSSGAFQEDLQRFHATLIGADNKVIREAVISFSDRYDDDVIFQQFLEQLETSMLEGKTNVDTLKDIKTYHNDIRDKQNEYERRKNGHLSDMKQLVFVTVILILALSLSFGLPTYLEAFARHWTGYISAGIYLLLMWGYFRKFTNYLFDDSVMEIRTK